MKYEYVCPDCDLKKDVHRPMAEDEGEYFCDDCGAKVKRDYSDPAYFKPSPGMYSHKGY